MVNEAAEEMLDLSDMARVPNRVAKRRAERLWGERKPERSRIRRLSKKERMWRR